MAFYFTMIYIRVWHLQFYIFTHLMLCLATSAQFWKSEIWEMLSQAYIVNNTELVPCVVMLALEATFYLQFNKPFFYNADENLKMNLATISTWISWKLHCVEWCALQWQIQNGPNPRTHPPLPPPHYSFQNVLKLNNKWWIFQLRCVTSS